MNKGFVLILFFMLLLSPRVSPAGKAQKPLPPLSVTIHPIDQTLAPERIRPGDIVELRVTAKSFIDSPEMRITVKLAGGAELISGDTSWAGPAVKNREQALTLTVRAPQTGKGRVKAHVVIPGTERASFSVQSVYSLGPEQKPKTRQEPAVKKDGKGRGILEYRVQ